MKEELLGIYIHVPYCLQKCRYCDFVSFEKAPQDDYFRMLAEQIRVYSEQLGRGEFPAGSERFMLHSEPSVDSIFFGGGTPSLASCAQLGIVLDALRSCFEVAEDAEITIEANPETVTKEKAAELKQLGFSRVSMGVQSLDDDVLDAMGRVHCADRARKAFHILRDAGFDNINLDLIFGAPCQDLEIWHHTLDEILAMKPEHLSFYSLQLEEGTSLYDDYNSGKIDLPSWEENRRMYHSALQLIKGKGYHHYEVSNAAIPGFECRHNLKYWNMQPYLGFGLSAHSFVNGCRGELKLLQPEAEADLKGDFIFTKLRLIGGFDVSEYRELFETDFMDDFRDALSGLIEGGFIISDGDRIKLTEKGLDNTNPVMERLLACCTKRQ